MEASELIAKINSLKNSLKTAEASYARFQGMHAQALDTLKKDFGIDSLAEAEVEVDRLNEEITQMTSNLEARTLRLEKIILEMRQ